ncbi:MULTISPECIES: hypothetical protein [unclassified Enterococcus]|uniref:hypothetical protein n=1 Tax=unclassified Enterococcus TaxID=2608891 RepID=UPI001CE033BC|nr:MULTISPECIES: hypothetical protein [unclassified Enterococcus]MCA5011970.1 hypothetical protein [Enterococcus sp. S23]MCA5015221.1 hypothetical protein [Enterococcus sp. S22(2020)]
MKGSYKTVVFETSLYYILLAIVLPLIYAVTYHVAFLSVFTTEWLAVTLFLYPIVLVLSTIRYGYIRIRKTSHS